jgi:hypothetical protein
MELEMAGETEVLGEKFPTVPHCPQQIPRDLTWDRNLVAAIPYFDACYNTIGGVKGTLIQHAG